ncbi:MAG: hypothetical protein CVU03_04260 [Bacteroidetes bacterium HGW-Bacteroidetes-2]|jgi:hypothetical protein|nr:MAG: hypothetical protein CVU03_04260 [Bacteroidetes bacterium HGW-Bacteroidetes-2]
MKYNFFLAIIALMILSFLSLSCSNDGNIDHTNSGNVSQLQDAIIQGNWKITRFIEEGVNQTSNYTGFNFTFNANGSVLATNGSTPLNGTWTTSISSSGTPKFLLNFNISNGPFDEISEDWNIETVSISLIDLKHVSGGDGSIDLLLFTKV